MLKRQDKEHNDIFQNLHSKLRHSTIENEQSCQIGNEYNENSSIAGNTDDDDLRIDLSGKYEITLSDVIIDKMYTENTVCVKWHSKDKVKQNNDNFRLNPVFVKCLHRHITQSGENISKVIGYTRAIITNPETNERNIFYCDPSYQGREYRLHT